MEEYTVYVKCDNLLLMQYYSHRFVIKYAHRIVRVSNQGFEIRLLYDDGKMVDIVFELWNYYKQAILGKRNVRSISAEVSELLDFNYIESVIGLPIEPVTYRPS